MINHIILLKLISSKIKTFTVGQDHTTQQWGNGKPETNERHQTATDCSLLNTAFAQVQKYKTMSDISYLSTTRNHNCYLILKALHINIC